MIKILQTAGMLFFLVCVASAVGACGKKTAPISPDGTSYPQQYPR